MTAQPSEHQPAPAGHAESPLEHIVQHPLIERPANLGPLTPDGKITLFSDQIAMILLAGVLLIALVPILVRRRPRQGAASTALVPTGPANALEADLRSTSARRSPSRRCTQHTDRFIKYIWSVFFFVLTVNMLGLLPIPAVSQLFGTHLGGTATGNIWVTATLAIVTMGMMVVNGLRLGGKAYLAHFCPGPFWMAPLLVPVEIIGLVAKVFALAVRLFANMIAGHILLAVLLSFILSAGAISAALGPGHRRAGRARQRRDQHARAVRGVPAGVHFHVPDDAVHRDVVVFHHDDHGDHHEAATKRRRTEFSNYSPCPQSGGADAGHEA